MVFRCIAANQRADALPIGLAAGVVYNAKARGKLEKAAGKMEERFLGRSAPDEATIERWNAVAAEVIRLQITDPRLKGSLLQRADEILHELGAEKFAYLSSTSPLGFGQRLARFGKDLACILDGKGGASLEDLMAARVEIGDHELAARERRRLDRVDMAIRLVRWLKQRETTAQGEPRSLVEASDYHLAEGGFVDWARLTLRTGDPIRELSEAYGKLFGRVTELREARSREFAELLRTWTESNSALQGLVPVERFLEVVVAPLAAHSPVLLIVLDGMSVAVCRELLPDLLGQDWIPLNREGKESLLSAGLATIPSVTEVSRTSLLCGQLRQGSSADELAGFEAHPALRTHCKSGFPPIVFHKSALRGEGDAVLAGRDSGGDRIARPTHCRRRHQCHRRSVAQGGAARYPLVPRYDPGPSRPASRGQAIPAPRRNHERPRPCPRFQLGLHAQRGGRAMAECCGCASARASCG